MKHPSHTSTQNEYSGRSSKKLNKSNKTLLGEEMKKFNERMKRIMK